MARNGGFNITRMRRGGRGRPFTRVNKKGEWRCYGCKKHKPVIEFYQMKPYNRPQSLCIPCGLIASRDGHRRKAKAKREAASWVAVKTVKRY